MPRLRRSSVVVSMWLLVGCPKASQPMVAAPADRQFAPAPAPEPASDPEPKPSVAGDDCPSWRTPGEPGPAFVLVPDVGLVRISDAGVDLTVPSKEASTFAELAVDRDGTLWASKIDAAQLVRIRGNRTRRFSLDRRDTFGVAHFARHPGGPLWIATDDIEWTVGTFDGKRYRVDRKRKQFARDGGFSDNKLDGLAATADGVYVASWNGLFQRLPSGDWVHVPAPDEVKEDDHPGAVFGTDRGLVAVYNPTVHLRRDGAWQRLQVPASLRAINRHGATISATGSDGKTQVTFSDLAGRNCVATGVVDGFAFDTALDDGGRGWLATELGLSVVDPDGTTVASWGIGELAHLTASPRAVAVVGAGPSHLPAPREVAKRAVSGRLEFFKSGAAIVGVRLTMCHRSLLDEQCRGAPRMYTTVTTDGGRFTFDNVAAVGELGILVQPLPEAEECQTPFEPEPLFLDAGDCPGTGPCDLGTLEHCVMFEMPPMP